MKLITTWDKAADKLPAAERSPQNIFYEVYININILLNHRRPVGESGFKRKTIPGQHQRSSWRPMVVRLKVGLDHQGTKVGMMCIRLDSCPGRSSIILLPLFKVLAVYMERLKRLTQKEKIHS